MRKIIKGSKCIQCGIFFKGQIDDLKLFCSSRCKELSGPVCFLPEVSKKNAPESRKKKPILSKGVRRTNRIRELEKENKSLNAELKKFKALVPGRGAPGDSFYQSEAWLKLRYRVIKKFGRVCMACRTSSGVMHVDHIKPRSKHPHLELEITNLQILCKSCNLGKSNVDDTDWRRPGDTRPDPLL